MYELHAWPTPNGYKISGEGQGGVAGFGKGSAKVRLTDDSGGTMLAYAVTASVGGKLAQIGSRLIDSTAKKLADGFFATFGQLAAARALAAPTAEAATAPETTMTPPPASARLPAADEGVPGKYVIAGIAAALLMLIGLLWAVSSR